MESSYKVRSQGPNSKKSPLNIRVNTVEGLKVEIPDYVTQG